MAKVKLLATVVLAVLGMIVVLQNTEPVNTRILFWSITMPRAILLVGTSLIGFAVGVLTTFFLGDRARRAEPPPAQDKQLAE
jgi:uncharacterized integral membrane protein